MNISTHAVSLTLAISVALVGLSVHLVARVWSPRRLFFVPLARDIDASSRARVRRVLVINFAVTLIGVVASFVLSGDGVWVGLTTLLPFVSIAVLLMEMVRVTRSQTHAPVPARFAVPIEETPSVWSYVSMPLELAQLALLVLGSALFVRVMARLPPEVPLHWNAQGVIDRVGSPGALWVFAGIMAFNIALAWTITFTSARERWALPDNDREEYVRLQRERRRLIVRLVEVIMLSINLSLVMMWLGIGYGSLPDQGHLIMVSIVAGVVVMAIGTIAPIALYLGPMTRTQERIRAIAGTDVLGTREAGWLWHGMVYYAPDDPAVFVPKRIGIGQTVNFARPSAWVFLVGVVVAPLAVTAVVMAFAG